MLDEVFKDTDVLVSSATPNEKNKNYITCKIWLLRWKGKIEMNGNTCPINLTGRPSMAIPCGFGKKCF